MYSAAFLPLVALAYPSNLFSHDFSDETLAEITSLAAQIKEEALTRRQLGLNVVKFGFDAKSQYVSTTGEYRFVSCSPRISHTTCEF